MDATEVTTRLLVETHEGLDDIASRLCNLFDKWREAGAPDDAVDWLAHLIIDLGWWQGRVMLVADCMAAGVVQAPA